VGGGGRRTSDICQSPHPLHFGEEFCHILMGRTENMRNNILKMTRDTNLMHKFIYYFK
jgi:hypothetical protein